MRQWTGHVGTSERVVVTELPAGKVRVEAGRMAISDLAELVGALVVHEDSVFTRNSWTIVASYQDTVDAVDFLLSRMYTRREA